MRLAALQRCRPLAGTEMMASWRARADTFPRKLVSALVEQALAPEVLTSWSAREALLSRGDDLAVRDLLTRTGLAAVRVFARAARRIRLLSVMGFPSASDLGWHSSRLSTDHAATAKVLLGPRRSTLSAGTMLLVKWRRGPLTRLGLRG
jgi:hypothetical protein